MISQELLNPKRYFNCPDCGNLYEARDKEVRMFEKYECPQCESDVYYESNEILTMRVQMSSYGNIDWDEDPNVPISPNKFWVVGSFKEASGVCLAYIKEFHLGGGHWTGGKIYDKETLLGRVSYNGRVWDNDGKEILI